MIIAKDMKYSFNFFPALFMIRDGKFCNDLPDEVKEAFVDTNQLDKIKVLKDILKEKFPVSI
jgi:hypothetical protein